MNKEKTKRQLQAIKTKDKIYASAIRLFFIKGYDSVTIEEICSDAGVSKGLFYNYYTSKDEILIVVFQEVETVYQEIRNAFLPGETSLERLIMSTERVLLFVLSNELRKEAVRIAYISALKEANSHLVNRDREFFSIVSEIIRYGQQRGEIRSDLDVELIKNFIISHIFGCYFYWIADNKFDILKEMKSHISMIFKGICAEPRQ